MKITVLESKPISRDVEPMLLDRRRLFKSVGLVAIGAALPMYAGVKQANAGWVDTTAKLISAAISAVDLYKELWHVHEPTQGTIRFVNHHDYMREGNLWLGVLNSQNDNVSFDDDDIDNYEYLPFRVPPSRQITYGFQDGPYGRFPGQKIMMGRTNNGSSTTSMTVEL
jgi:hypothetical protein